MRCVTRALAESEDGSEDEMENAHEFVALLEVRGISPAQKGQGTGVIGERLAQCVACAEVDRASAGR